VEEGAQGLEGLRKTTKNLKIADILARIRTGHLLNTSQNLSCAECTVNMCALHWTELVTAMKASSPMCE
jgi:hypothetical protein